MATYLEDLVNSIPARWSEVETLLPEAAKHKGASTANLHDALCRGTSVLIVAHLEGYIRETVKAILRDINTYSTFAATPELMRVVFANYFLPQVEAKSEEVAATLKLRVLFEGLNAKFTHEPFLFAGKYDDNKNPSPGAIEHVLKNFGVDKMFNYLLSPRLAVVFSGTNTDMVALIGDLRTHVLAGVSSYPYSVDPIPFNLETQFANPRAARTLWQTFLDSVLKRRHDIAHGSTVNNNSSVEEIRTDLNKVTVLQYAITILLCNKSI